MSEWISVKHRLPEKDVDVLLHCTESGQRFYVGRWVWVDERAPRWEYADGEYGVYGVTHWMPLPDPPNETSQA